MKVWVQVVIDHLENLNSADLEEGCSLLVKIGWIGSKRKMRYLAKNAKQNQTSSRSIQADGVVRWSEEFDNAIKLKRFKTEGYKSWFLYLKIQEGKNYSSSKSLIAPTAKIDITKDLVMGVKRTVRVPVDCRIRGKITTVILEVAIRITECQVELMNSRFSFKRATSSLLFSCSGVESCVPSIHNARALRGRGFSAASLEDSTIRPRNQATDCSSSEGEPEPSYKDLRFCNTLFDQFKAEADDDDHHIPMYRSYLTQSPDISPHKNQEEQNQSPIRRLLSRVISCKKDEQLRGVPLLNKSRSDIGGDDIDIQRHKESDSSHISGNPSSGKVHPEETLCISGFGEDGPFEVGNWERRSIFSRDGELELLTDVFLATIDQRSEKASGGNACTVLAVLIADWLHENPGFLPLKCQLDQLVREGSLIWRGLCENENHRERFSDQHFDLETVLKEEIIPLREVVDLSYVGFLGIDELQEDTERLAGAMSFDSMWDKIMHAGTEMKYQVYVCSWNDHFFVVKMERDAIYLIDTFGERLFEGCNQAYILKFDKDSVIYSHEIKMGLSTPTEGGGGVDSSQVSNKEGNCDAEENKEATSGETKPCKEENMENLRIKDYLARETTSNCVEQFSKEETKPCKEENMENDKIKIKHYLAKEASGNGEQWKSKTCSNGEIERDEEETKKARCKEVVSEGKDSCREYIKGFLASLPVRQLQLEMRNGSIREDTFYKRLQIEFHYVAPCTMH